MTSAAISIGLFKWRWTAGRSNQENLSTSRWHTWRSSWRTQWLCCTNKNLPLSSPSSNRAGNAVLKILEEGDKEAIISHAMNYPRLLEYLHPTLSSPPGEEENTHNKTIVSKGDDLYGTFSYEQHINADRWLDLYATFRLHSIRTCPQNLTYKWYCIFRSHGLHVSSGRYVSHTEARTGCYFGKEHLPSSLLNAEEAIETSLSIGKRQKNYSICNQATEYNCRPGL